jgi:hypothetical protein
MISSYEMLKSVTSVWKSVWSFTGNISTTAWLLSFIVPMSIIQYVENMNAWIFIVGLLAGIAIIIAFLWSFGRIKELEQKLSEQSKKLVAIKEFEYMVDGLRMIFSETLLDVYRKEKQWNEIKDGAYNSVKSKLTGRNEHIGISVNSVMEKIKITT